jgi:hypothetical protein
MSIFRSSRPFIPSLPSENNNIMKKSIAFSVFAILFTSLCYTQVDSERDLVEAACMNYFKGFYDGDTTKIIESFQPTLNKFGYWKDKDSGEYGHAGHMSYEQAIGYARGISEKGDHPGPEAPREIEILDVMNHIASAKLTAWWGTDYLLLSKQGDKWMIEQVLWEGPLEK